MIGQSDSGECDVLVIGSGSAGLAAALRSAVAGLRVIILEKSGYLGGILGTKGGARTNAKGQVLRADGTVIAGLYAAGLAMANPVGTRAVGPGTTIGPNLTWGFICGGTMIDERRNAR